MRRAPETLLPALLAGALIAGTAGCQRETTVDHIREAGVLRVATLNSPTTYYEDRTGPTGFEHALARRFAQHLGVKLDLHVSPGPEELIVHLERNRADIAAAGLTVTLERMQRVRFGPPYMDVTQELVYRTGNPRPRTLADLEGSSLVVQAGSSHAERLRELAGQNPALRWEEDSERSVIDLLRQVEEGIIDHTVVDSNELAVDHAFFPHIRAAFSLTPPEDLAWALNRDRDPSLLREVESFFTRLQVSGALESMRQRFYGHVEQLNYVGARTFIYHYRRRLPAYGDWFRAAADRYGFDWRLLAAVGYQESHWDPTAVSPTGVRGIMMLTRVTAREIGVKNRLDPRQSIFGGADYLSRIRNRLPPEAKEPDRTWLALAAYNVGYGHLQDAQEITVRQGGDPYRWVDVMERLPLLQKKRWYAQTRYGYARGYEPVQYVQNIRRYYDVLIWLTRDGADEGIDLAPAPGTAPELDQPLPSVL